MGLNRFLIAYDLQKEVKDYDRIHEAIKGLDERWTLGRILNSMWLVETNLKADEIINRLNRIDPERNDRLLVVGLSAPWDCKRLRTDDYLRKWFGPPMSNERR